MSPSQPREPGLGQPKARRTIPGARIVKARRQKPGGVSLRGFLRRIHDPYLADAVTDYERILKDLKSVEEERLVDEDMRLLCELSRAAAIRLLPFTKAKEPVIRWARDKFRETLALHETKPVTDSTNKYAQNIRKRLKDLEAFLNRD